MTIPPGNVLYRLREDPAVIGQWLILHFHQDSRIRKQTLMRCVSSNYGDPSRSARAAAAKLINTMARTGPVRTDRRYAWVGDDDTRSIGTAYICNIISPQVLKAGTTVTILPGNNLSVIISHGIENFMGNDSGSGSFPYHQYATLISGIEIIKEVTRYNFGGWATGKTEYVSNHSTRRYTLTFLSTGFIQVLICWLCFLYNAFL